jgi:uncharacterized protein YjbI with pentapeptide repeats
MNNSRFEIASFDSSNLSDVNFMENKLKSVYWSQANITEIDFSGTNLSKQNFSEAEFDYINAAPNTLSGAIFNEQQAAVLARELLHIKITY